MHPEIKALKEVVETFGRMMQQLNSDYIIFKAWFEDVIATANIEEVMTERIQIKRRRTTTQGPKEMTTEERKKLLIQLDSLKEINTDTTIEGNDLVEEIFIPKKEEEENKKGDFDFNFDDIKW